MAGWDGLLCILISIGMIVNILAGFKESEMQSALPLVIVCTLGAVFAASRTRVGMIVLFLAGTLIQAGASFLQFPCSLAAYMLFLTGSVWMYFFRIYVISLGNAHTGKVRTGKLMLQNVWICVLAMALAGGIFCGIVKPLDPPVHELKLIQKQKSFDLLEKIGVVSHLEQPNLNRQSDQKSEETLATSQTDETQEDTDSSGQNQKISGTQADASTSEQIAQTLQKPSERVQAITYHETARWYLWVIVAVAAVLFFLWLYNYRKKRWFTKLEQLSLSRRILCLYAYFLKRWEKQGCVRAGNQTLDEYLQVKGTEMQTYDSPDASWAHLTEIYRKVYYGGMEASEQDYTEYLKYYEVFGKQKKIKRKKSVD